MPDAIFLEGKRIGLRLLSANDDLSAYERWVNDQETVTYMGTGRFPSSIAQLKAYIDGYNGSKDFLLGIFLKSNQRHIGNITLHQIDRQNQSGEIGILLGEKDCRGQGLGTEALGCVVEHGFKRMNLHKLTAGMVDGNIASQKIFEKLGFLQEGRLREHFYLNGHFCDCLRYGLLRTEYLKPHAI